MNIEQELKELRERLDELEKQAKENKRTSRSVLGQRYYILNTVGSIVCTTSKSDAGDEYIISVGNCFRTEEEAEKHKRILINTQKLKDLAERLNKDVEMEFSSEEQCRYYIGLMREDCF